MENKLLGNDSQKNGELFKKIFEMSPYALAIAGMDYRLIKVNAMMCRLTGYSEKELYPFTIKDISHPAYLKQLMQGLEKLINGEIPYFKSEKQYIKKNKEVIWIKITVNIIRDKDGKPEYFLGLIDDINERKILENEKSSFLKAIASANEGIALTDKKDRYVYVNNAHAKIYGYVQEELFGKTWHDLVPDRDIPHIEKSFKKIMLDKKIGEFNIEGTGLRKDGSIIPIAIRAKSLWDEEGNYAGHICIVTDISERKIKEQILKESEEKYRILLDNALEGVIFALGPELHVIYANRAMAEITGYTVQELSVFSHEQVLSLIHPDYRKVLLDRFENRLDGKNVKDRYEFRGIRKDGQERWVEITSKLITYKEQPAVQICFLDITDRKNAEKSRK